MAETLKLQLVKCPACNAPISSFSSFKSTVKCPRCGSVCVNPTVHSSDIPQPDRIIPFTTQEKDFETALVASLIDTDYVDRKVFEGINTENVFRAYLPMYLYEGNYTAPWSCEVAYTVKVGDKKETNWKPQTGSASGNFAFLCLANEGSEDLPAELRDFARNFPYEVMDSKQFNPDLLSDEDDNLITIERNADSELVWQKHGKDMVDQTAQDAAIYQTGGSDIRNFRCSSSYQLTTNGKFVLAPFWFVYYNYNNKQYHFLMDGLAKNTSGSCPLDANDLAFTEKREKIEKWIKWAWVLAILMWWLVDFGWGFITLCLWGIGWTVAHFVIKSQIKKLLAEGREARLQSAQRQGMLQ